MSVHSVHRNTGVATIREKVVCDQRIGLVSFEIRVVQSFAIRSLLFLAGFASGVAWQSQSAVLVIRLDPARKLTIPRSGAANDNRPAIRQVTIRLARILPDARGLGVPVRRRQCKSCRQPRCLCVFWRGPSEGRDA